MRHSEMDVVEISSEFADALVKYGPPRLLRSPKPIRIEYGQRHGTQDMCLVSDCSN